MNDHGITQRAWLPAILLALSCLASPAVMAAESGWEYSADIYLWAPKLTATTPGGGEAELPFYDILDDLKMGFMGIAKAQNEQWSLTADAIYLNLDKKVNRDTSYEGLPIDLTGKASLKGWIVTPTVGYAVHNSEQSRMEIIGGVRYLWLKAGAKVIFDGLEAFNESESGDFWDAVIGARTTFNLNEKWFLPL